MNREIKYRVYSRMNVFADSPNTIGWVLEICFNDPDWWTVQSWDNKPHQEEIKKLISNYNHECIQVLEDNL